MRAAGSNIDSAVTAKSESLNRERLRGLLEQARSKRPSFHSIIPGLFTVALTLWAFVLRKSAPDLFLPLLMVAIGVEAAFDGAVRVAAARTDALASVVEDLLGRLEEREHDRVRAGSDFSDVRAEPAASPDGAVRRS